MRTSQTSTRYVWEAEPGPSFCRNLLSKKNLNCYYFMKNNSETLIIGYVELYEKQNIEQLDIF